MRVLCDSAVMVLCQLFDSEMTYMCRYLYSAVAVSLQMLVP